MLDAFDLLEFDEGQHRYTRLGEEFTSSTGLIKKLHNVDTDMLAANYSMKTGIPKEKLLSDWALISDVAANYGTKVHKYGEDIGEFGIENVRKPECPKELGVYFSEVDFLGEGYEPVTQELIMCSLEHWPHKTRYAGMLDRLYKKGSFLCIVDFKTNKSLHNETYGERFKFPFDARLASNFNKYTIQQNLYKILIEQVTGIQVSEMYLIWLNPLAKRRYERVKVPNIQREVIAWLNSKDLNR